MQVTDTSNGIVWYDCHDHMETMRRVIGMFCPLPFCRTLDEFPSQRELVQHMRNMHQSSQFCQLCLNSRPLFPSEQEMYSFQALKQHEQLPNGHPLCRFCQKRFFDGADLYEHMNGVHLNCFLCPLEQRHRYYRNVVQLRDHLRINHYLCELPPCDSTEAVQAFSTADELRIHAVTEHGEKSSKGITLGFRVASFRDTVRDNNDRDDELRQGVICPPPPRRPSSHIGMNRLSVQMQRQVGNEQNRDTSGQMERHQFSEMVGPDSSDFNTVFPSLPTPSSRIDHEELSLIGQHLPTVARNPNPNQPSSSYSDAGSDMNLDSAAGITMSKGAKRRNRRLAIALGIGVRDLDNRENFVQWPRELVLWARNNLTEVSNIENSIQKMLLDPKATSIQLKPMIKLYRKRAHELAEIYGLKSVAYDQEPKRYLSVIKQHGAHVCHPLLSDAARDVNYCIGSCSTSYHPHETARHDLTAIVKEEEKKEAYFEGGDGIRSKNSVLKRRLKKPEGRLSLPEEARMKAIGKERQAMEERNTRIAEMGDHRRAEKQAGYIESHESLFHGLDVNSDDEFDDSSSKDDEWETAADRILLNLAPCNDNGGDAWDDGPPAEPLVPYAREGMWVCKRCTYAANSDSVRRCGICGEENGDLGWTVVS